MNEIGVIARSEKIASLMRMSACVDSPIMLLLPDWGDGPGSDYIIYLCRWWEIDC